MTDHNDTTPLADGVLLVEIPLSFRVGLPENNHVHEWRKTGERHPTPDPIYFWSCVGCQSVGKAQEGKPVREIQKLTDAEWEEWYTPEGRARPLPQRSVR